MKVLVVDDELVSRRKKERLLQSLGYEARVAKGGVEGWEIWKSERPRIVITDWNMPHMDWSCAGRYGRLNPRITPTSFL